jgi:preprotein translocase subunit YajC
MHKTLFLSDLPTLLAQQTPPAGAAPGSSGGFPFMLVVWGLFIAAMWFLMIAPQRKKQKEHQRMLAEIKSGDEVVTIGGIYGVVITVKEDRFVVRIGDNTKVEVGKGFIQAVEKKAS